MKSLCSAILVLILGVCLAVPAGYAAPPQPQSQQSSTAQVDPTKKPAPPAADTPQPAKDQGQAQGQAQDQGQTSSSDEDQTPKGVKAGSEKDVNSIGNRNVDTVK